MILDVMKLPEGFGVEGFRVSGHQEAKTYSHEACSRILKREHYALSLVFFLSLSLSLSSYVYIYM